MNEFFFKKNREDGSEPQDVRFQEIRVEPWEDKRRLRILVTLTPFRKSPNLEFKLLDARQNLVSEASIIESDEDQFVFTMHFRIPDPVPPFTLSCELKYEDDIGTVDTYQTEFEID